MQPGALQETVRSIGYKAGAQATTPNETIIMWWCWPGSTPNRSEAAARRGSVDSQGDGVDSLSIIADIAAGAAMRSPP
jgi:hypothetical protein